MARRIYIAEQLTAAHLLCDHNHKRGQSRAAYSRNSEQLEEPSEISTLPDRDLLAFRDPYASNVTVAEHDLLETDLTVDVVKISGRLKRGITESAEGFESFPVSMLLDVPTRRFRAKIYSKHQGNGRDASGSQLQTPSQDTNLIQRQVGSQTP